MRQFDNNAVLQSQPNNIDLNSDAKFQTPKGPNMFHNHSLNHAGSSVVVANNISTPDQFESGNKQSKLDSNQKNLQMTTEEKP